MRYRATLLGLILITTAACATDDTSTRQAEESSASLPGEVESLGITNARIPSQGLITAGQVTDEQFDALAALGYTNFVSLRPTSERGAGWEEAHAAGTSASFTRIPITGGDDLTRENVARLAELLEAAEGEGSVVYCASSNRVGALLALKAYWLDGADPDEAMAIGRSAGLTRLEGRVGELLAEGR